MLPIEGQPILTAAQMRAAKERAAPTPEAMYALMERAGAGVAEAVRRVAAGAEVLILCGPGNNGGDGYVAARVLRAWGHPVRVAALVHPQTALARRAAAVWAGPTCLYTRRADLRGETNPWGGDEPEGAPVLIDALFGTGARPVDPDELWIEDFRALFEQARLKVAVDLPLGATADGSRVPPVESLHADLTLALGALKQAHVMPAAMDVCGEVRVIDLGLRFDDGDTRVNAQPVLRRPRGDASKFDRGVVGVIAGAMPGAAHLAATAAARAGAGYVIMFGEAPGGPDAIVRRPLVEEALMDKRITTFVVGPGLGRDEKAQHWLNVVLRLPHRTIVIDADALRLLRLTSTHRRLTNVILTPHGGEYRALEDQFAPALLKETKEQGVLGNVAALARTMTDGIAVVVSKGSTTVLSDGRRTRVSPRGNSWLSTAGTGDVLAGTIGAMAADPTFDGKPLIDAAAAGVWLHAEAGRRCGASFIADDLAHALTAARASLCR